MISTAKLQKNLYISKLFFTFARFFVKKLFFWMKNIPLSRWFAVSIFPAQERWQSGLLRRSWKPKYWKVPGVRIPLFPQAMIRKQVRCIQNRQRSVILYPPIGKYEQAPIPYWRIKKNESQNSHFLCASDLFPDHRLRKERDSNPRYLSVLRFSRPTQ